MVLKKTIKNPYFCNLEINKKPILWKTGAVRRDVTSDERNKINCNISPVLIFFLIFLNFFTDPIIPVR